MLAFRRAACRSQCPSAQVPSLPRGAACADPWQVRYRRAGRSSGRRGSRSFGELPFVSSQAAPAQRGMGGWLLLPGSLIRSQGPVGPGLGGSVGNRTPLQPFDPVLRFRTLGHSNLSATTLGQGGTRGTCLAGELGTLLRREPSA